VKLIEGNLLADKIQLQLKQEVVSFKSKPGLAVILVGENPASLSYIRQKNKAADKIGINFQTIKLPAKTNTAKLIQTIQRLNRDKKIHGIIVQLPLPSQINETLILNAIDPSKDVDGFHPLNRGKVFLNDETGFAPCTPKGILKLLEYSKCSPRGKHVVIVGRSNLVGKPLAVMLINQQATVTVCNSQTRRLKQITQTADIFISAMGQSHFFKNPAWFKKGVVLIDVGFSKVKDKICGDIQLEKFKNLARAGTPVPGGVGPLTVACLMENVIKAWGKNKM